MNSLPELAGGRFRYHLPLAEETAIRLAGVLLAASAQERAERLEAALICDAALAVWAILVAPEPADSAAPLPTLVAWLAPRIAQLLASSSATPQRADSTCARQSEPHRLSADRDRSLEPTGSRPHVADMADRNRRFIGRVTGAVEWLMECGTPKPDRHEATQALPAWLIQILEHAPSPSHADAQPCDRRSAAPGSEDWAALVERLAARTVRLAELEANFENAVEQAKLAALKGFAYGAGHEINNPLANISARAQTLLKDEHDPERRQKLAAINTQAFRAHEMIADLMLFAQPPEWKPDRVAVGPLLAELAPAWRRQAADQQTILAVQIADESLAAWADRSALAVALRALVANALEALGRGGTIEIAVTPARLAREVAAGETAFDDSPLHGGPPGGSAPGGSAPLGAASLDAATRDAATLDAAPDAVAICVRDDGPGIDPAARARIFDPFFSGREAGRGLGFGLPKCWRIATALGGRIDVASGPAAGAALTLVLPLAPDDSARTAGR